MIENGSRVEVLQSQELGVVVGRTPGASSLLFHHVGEMNIPIYPVLLDSGELRFYRHAALKLARE